MFGTFIAMLRTLAATAHQNEQYPLTPDQIRAATGRLAQRLRERDLPMTVFPNAEVMAHPELEAAWQKGEYLSVGDRGQYMLLEMPHGLFVDLRHLAGRLRQAGVRPILAHPERQPELLHEPGQVEQLIRLGCLVQVSSASVTDPANRGDEKALRGWFRRGLVHLLGSDGHSPRRRPPRMAAAYGQIARWAGGAAADRICSTTGMAILQGLPVYVPEPLPRRRPWSLKFW